MGPNRTSGSLLNDLDGRKELEERAGLKDEIFVDMFYPYLFFNKDNNRLERYLANGAGRTGL
jgi:hypothetical protein